MLTKQNVFSIGEGKEKNTIYLYHIHIEHLSIGGKELRMNSKNCPNISQKSLIY